MTAPSSNGQSPCPPGAACDSWSGFARDASHSSTADGSLTLPLGAPAWVRSVDDSGRAIAFVGQSSVAVSRTLVCAIGSTGSGQTLQFWCFGLSRFTGGVVWVTPVARPLLDSYSTPVIDEIRQQVIVTTGRQVVALNLMNGAQRWVINTVQPIVNASPVITNDLGVCNRMFFTDYDGAGTGGSLHCVNIDEFHTLANPYMPGETVWSVVIGGTSGNTPAYADGRVYVCTAGEYGVSGGEVRCYDARSTSTPTPLWVTPNPIGEGFYSGPSVANVGGVNGQDAVYAASYAFFGTISSANLLKLRASDGAVVWSTPSNRTSMTPIVMSDGRIVLSTGVSGFGSLPALQVFRDLSVSASMVWDSSIATWSDSNSNGVRDTGEYTRLGGWTVQPALDRATNSLFVGVIPTGGSGACASMGVVALGALATSVPQIQTFVPNCGSSPVIAGRNVYSIGLTGLHAFGAPPPQGDINSDGRLDEADLYAFGPMSLAQDPRCDVNADGQITSADRELLEVIVRAGESETLDASRRQQEAGR
ncbi:MAG: PQQ-binding-like beta-propeller repeat protein [Planctomycetes bacterium]|nr:PQQ-binding-like beta-propeller repeat protein [Planctomycetota bacterium]